MEFNLDLSPSVISKSDFNDAKDAFYNRFFWGSNHDDFGSNQCDSVSLDDLKNALKQLGDFTGTDEYFSGFRFFYTMDDNHTILLYFMPIWVSTQDTGTTKYFNFSDDSSNLANAILAGSSPLFANIGGTWTSIKGDATLEGLAVENENRYFTELRIKRSTIPGFRNFKLGQDAVSGFLPFQEMEQLITDNAGSKSIGFYSVMNTDRKHSIIMEPNVLDNGNGGIFSGNCADYSSICPTYCNQIKVKGNKISNS